MAKILIVEDDEWQRKLLKAFVASLGHQTLEHEDGSGVLATVREHRPEIVLLDWVLPGLSGLEVCGQIRASPQSGEVYILFLTAHNDEGSLAQALAAGGDDYVSKPANPTELQARINAGLRTLEASRLERRRMEEQLRQSQKLESIGRLVGGIAHDFNNLLTVINGYAQFLQMDLPPGDPLRESLRPIGEAGERAALLTRQLLSFSRRNPSAASPLSLNDQIRGLLRMVERIVGEHVRLETHLDPDGWLVTADPSGVDQVLMNLLVNARDAMPQGGTITLTTRNLPGDLQSPDRVSLRVEDTGTGMSEEVRERLFEPFFTTKGDRGTGLGLATVHDIVTQAGGRIEVRSRPGAGSCFEITLPRSAAGSRSVSTLAFAPAAGSPGERVLVVEDDPEVLRWCAATLRRDGYEVFEAETAARAVAVFRREQSQIDVVVSDVMLPDGTGPDLVERLRRGNLQLRAVFMSGYPREWLDARTQVFSQDAFLEKPLRAEALTRQVRGPHAAPPSQTLLENPHA